MMAAGEEAAGEVEAAAEVMAAGEEAAGECVDRLRVHRLHTRPAPTRRPRRASTRMRFSRAQRARRSSSCRRATRDPSRHGAL